LIKAAKAGIYELELVLEGEDEELTKERVYSAEQRQKNVGSLEAIPAGLIDEYRRAELIESAKDGEDVYAYFAAASDSWNVWDRTRRIELRGSNAGWRYDLVLPSG
jgi:hypothetical protein